MTVSVFDLAKHEAVWQTWLAAPLAGELAVGADANKNSGQLITAVTASGGVFRAALDGLKPGCPPWEPLAAIDASMLAKPLRSLLPLPGGMYALTGGADTRDIWLYDPKVGDEPFHFMQCERHVDRAGGLCRRTACGVRKRTGFPARSGVPQRLGQTPGAARRGQQDLGVAGPGGRGQQGGRSVRRRPPADRGPHRR